MYEYYHIYESVTDDDMHFSRSRRMHYTALHVLKCALSAYNALKRKPRVVVRESRMTCAHVRYMRIFAYTVKRCVLVRSTHKCTVHAYYALKRKLRDLCVYMHQ